MRPSATETHDHYIASVKGVYRCTKAAFITLLEVSFCVSGQTQPQYVSKPNNLLMHFYHFLECFERK